MIDEIDRIESYEVKASSLLGCAFDHALRGQDKRHSGESVGLPHRTGNINKINGLTFAH